ncbi:hypothetical protein P7C73_g5473, partial [Tremellales sp. Uapishka_1]
MASTSTIHHTYEQFANGSAKQLNVHLYRDRFQDRALRDMTINSNDAASMMDPSNPILMGEEMESQKDYFRRLKFNYLEQEAKRNFLYSITGDEPQNIQPGENEELEIVNAEKKALLKATKQEIENMRLEAIRLAKSNTQQHAEVATRNAEAASLYKEIRDMELELARIKATHPPETRLTFDQANEVLEQQVNEIQTLCDAIDSQGERVKAVEYHLTRTVKEVHSLGKEREREEARAKEVKQGREQGDTKVDESCRWYTSSMTFYKSLLGIKSVKAISPLELHLEYTTSSPKSSATLVLLFGPDKRLETARMLNDELDIDESSSIAVRSNDIPGLVADVLLRLRK